MTSHLKYVLVLIAAFFLAIPAMAQDDAKAAFKGRVTELGTGAKMSGTKVLLYQDGKLLQTKTTTSSGRYSVEGPVGHVYTIRFQKAGYVDKSVEVAFTSIHEEDKMGVLEFTLDMDIYKDHPDVDFTPITSKPNGKGRFDPQMGDFVWDKKYNAKARAAQEKLLAELRKLEEEAKNKYPKLVAEADAMVKQQQFDEAIAKYEEAMTIKDDGSLPPKIENARKLKADLAAQGKKREEFDKVMAAAKGLFDSEKYEEAKTKYQEAQGILPDEKEPGVQIKKIDGILQAAADKEKRYNDFMTKGNGALGKEDFDGAITNYEGALGVKPNDPDATAKLKQAKDAKAEKEQAAQAEKDKRAKFDALVKEGDGLFDGEKWADSKTKYEEALTLFENEKHPKDRIVAIDKKLQELADAEAAEKEKRDQYDALIAAADGMFDGEKWNDAKSKYQEALKLFDEQHPNDRIKAIDKKLKDIANAEADAAAKQAEYDKLVAEADKLYDGEKWDDAKSKYQAALDVLDQQHPKDRIADIDKKLQSLADAEAAEKAKREEFDKLISEADGLFDGEKWEDSKSKYEEAKALFDEKYPNDRIKAIDDKLKSIAEADAAAQKAEQEKRDKYDKLVAEADQLFDGEKWNDSKSKYQEALDVLDEQHPKDRIATIDQKLLELADAEAAAKAEQEKYDNLIAEADGLYNNEKWEESKAKYEEALAVKKEKYPQDRIDDINGKLAAQTAENEKEEKFNNLVQEAEGLVAEAGNLSGEGKTDDAIAKYEAAKSKYKEAFAIKDDPSIQQKMDQVNDQISFESQMQQKKKEYAKIIKIADEKYNAGELEEAKGLYERARRAAEQGETYPDDQINEIDKQLGQVQAKEDEYNAMIAEADKAYDLEHWEDSKGKYEQALAMFERDHPKDRIADIEKRLKEIQDAENAQLAEKEKRDKFHKLVADADHQFDLSHYAEAKPLYEEALTLFDEKHPHDRLKLINDKLAQMDKKKHYEELIAKADQELADENYLGSKKTYEEAYKTMPEHHYPLDQIKKIDDILSKQAGEEQLEKEYQKRITIADEKFAAEDWEAAKSMYQQAHNLKKDESYPTDQIAKVDAAIAANKEKEKQYSDLIAKADASFGGKDYDAAKSGYNQALGLFDRQYPKDKLRDIERLLKDQAAQDQAAQAEQEKKSAYENLIAEADRLLDEKSYKESQGKYQEAYDLIPEKYPSDQIKRINEILEGITRKEDGERMYNKIIETADNYFNNKEWDDAESLYKRAMSLKQGDSYPPAQLQEIARLRKEEAQNAKIDEINAKYDALIAEADGYFNGKQWESAKDKYKAAYRVKAEQYPQDQLDEINRRMKQETQDQLNRMYDKIIAQADQDFDGKNYDDALSYYKRAKGLKPSDPYPQNRIWEIEDILNGKTGPNYGEEVYDVSLMDGAALIRQGKQNKFNRQVDSIHKAQDDFRESDLVMIGESTDKIYETDEQWDKFLDDIAENAPNNDVGRWENVTSAKEIDDFRREHKEGFEEGNIETTYVNDGVAKDVEDYRREYLESKDEIREGNVVRAKEIDDFRRETKEGFEDENKENTFTNDEAAKDIEDFRREYLESKDEIREGNVVRAKEVDDFRREAKEGFEDENKENTFTNHEAAKDIEDFRREYLESKDEIREGNVVRAKEVDDYRREAKEGFEEENIENTFTNHETAKDVEDFRREYLTEKDEIRQGNVTRAKEIDDFRRETKEGFEDFNHDNTFENEELTHDIEDYRREYLSAKDETRQENVVAAKEIDDFRRETKEGFEESNKENTFNNDEIAKDVEDFRRDHMASKEGNREDNIDTVKRRTDARIAHTKGMEDANKDNMFENDAAAKRIDDARREEDRRGEDTRLVKIEDADNKEADRIAVQESLGDGSKDRIESNEDFYKERQFAKPEKYTSEFKNELARKYPQGVTSNKYVKKDKHGDVYEVVIRKIVVKGNVGNDYVMFMTRFGRTYYKNGVAIPEFTWKDETSAAGQE